jgi:CDP-glucose 4,6-dehydratase
MQAWPAVRYRVERNEGAPHEATLLRLDCSLAASVLRWRPVWDGAPCFAQTAAWYRAFTERGEVQSREQLAAYVEAATQRRLPWTGAGT